MDRGSTAASIGMMSLCSDAKCFFEETFVKGRTTEISRGGSPRHSFKSLKRVVLLGKALNAHGAAFNQV